MKKNNKGNSGSATVHEDVHKILDSVISQNEDTICFQKKKFEHDLSAIGSKVADANDISHEIHELSEKQEKLLESVQSETGEIYEVIGEIECKI